MTKSITRLSFVSFIGGVAGRGLSYLLSIIIGRTIGSVGLGAFAVGFVILRLGASIASLGMDTAAQKFLPADIGNSRRERISGSVLIFVTVPLFAGLILAALVEHVIRTFGVYTGATQTVVLILLWGIPLLSIMRTSLAATKAYKETKYEAIVKQLVRPGCAIALLLSAYWLSGQLADLAIAYVASLAVTALSGLLFLYRLGAFSHVRSATASPRRLFSYSIPVTVLSIAYPLVVWTDILLLGYFVTGGIVGQYQAAYQTASLLTFALVSVNSIFPSVASELYAEGNVERLSVMYSVVTKWVAGLSLFAGAYEILFAGELLRLFGAQFTNARVLLYTLVIGQVCVCIVGPTGYLLSMAGHERLETINSVTMAFVNICLNVVLIDRFGAVGAAIATTVSISLLNLVRLAEVRHYLGIWPYNADFLRILPALAVAAVAMIPIGSFSIDYLLRLFLGGLIPLVAFLAIMGLVATTTEDKVIWDQV